jgi:hypothetical protein
MKLRTRIAAVLSVLALIAGFGVATSVPASALTLARDTSFEGIGNPLSACPAVGSTVIFGQGGCTDVWWQYQAEGRAGGDGTYYYIHPENHLGQCMTASTTQFGVIKIENCVGKSQQYWWNPHNSQGYYQLFNAYWGAFVDDARIGNATLIYSCSYGQNGCTFNQD